MFLVMDIFRIFNIRCFFFIFSNYYIHLNQIAFSISFESLKRLFSFYENVIVRSNEFDHQKFVFQENSVCAKQFNWINVMIWKEWKHVVKSESVYTWARVRAI